MVSYDFTASEVSFNPGQHGAAPGDVAVSLRGSNDSPRSKSRDRVASAGDHARPLTAHPVTLVAESRIPDEAEEDLDYVPPVPPLPSSFTGDLGAGTVVQGHASPDALLRSRSMIRNTKSRGGQSYHRHFESDGRVPVIDLETLLNGIDSGGDDHMGDVAKPPY
jgi:hypothetical protein